MSSTKVRILAAVLAAAGVVVIAGCASSDTKDTTKAQASPSVMNTK